jgi:hypothetical protein
MLAFGSPDIIVLTKPRTIMSVEHVTRLKDEKLGKSEGEGNLLGEV